MLQPRFHRDEVLEPLRTRWQDAGAVRVERVLQEAVAAGALEALRTQAHSPAVDPGPGQVFQLWRYAWRPEPVCDHMLCRIGRWLHSDGLTWIRALTGMSLVPSPDRVLVSDLHAKGSFIESHDAAGRGRIVEVRLGLTPAGWPAEWGGHLERLTGPGGDVVDRCAPAWNALDLLRVDTGPTWRRVPLVDKHLLGYTISAWLHAG